MPVTSSSSASASAANAGGLHSSYSAHHLPHLHHLHRQSSSPAANESNIETEEDEFGSVAGGVNAGGQFAHKLGSESEEEIPFAFRRKQSCDYMRVSFEFFCNDSELIYQINLLFSL